MSVADILVACKQKSIQIVRDKDELIIRAPKGAMTHQLADLLRGHKQLLLEELADSNPGASGSEQEKVRSIFKITPEMLTLVEMKQADIDQIASQVVGGIENIKDIYPLAPLQEGILFHHLMQPKGDIYLLPNVIAFSNKTRLETFLKAMQRVIERHDILRTGIFWEGLEQPVQVVHRRAEIAVEYCYFSDGEQTVLTQLQTHIDPLCLRIDVSRAPLVRCYIAEDPASDRWLLAIVIHHFIADHTSLDLMIEETLAIQAGRELALSQPVPFRNFIAQAKFGISAEEHREFFASMLGDIEEPTLPFEVQDIQAVDALIDEESLVLEEAFCQKLRQVAKLAGVSAASLFHLAWAMVLARLTGKQDVVFGTVLFGRMQGGVQADRAMGLFINTLPIRVTVDSSTAIDCLRKTHLLLVKLLKHEHASLSLAQKASGVDTSLPLFTAILNYRYSTGHPGQESDKVNELLGFEPISASERTNYPLSLAVDDLGLGFVITLQSRRPMPTARVNAYIKTAVEALVESLADRPEARIDSLDVLPEAETRSLTDLFNATALDYGHHERVHQAFERQAELTPNAAALVFDGEVVTYKELNLSANQLAHCLRNRSVGANKTVALCVERGVDMVVALLAVFKAGGAYVPLDPAYPADRLAHMLSDSGPVVCIVNGATADLVVNIGGHNLLDLDRERDVLASQPQANIPIESYAASETDLAYVIYTSGSTGKPKGVMVSQRNLMHFVRAMQQAPGLRSDDIMLSVTSLSFDIAGLEIYLPLVTGAQLVLASRADAADPQQLKALMEKCNVTAMQATPATWRMLVDNEWPCLTNPLKLLCGGEALPKDLAKRLLEWVPAVWNMYGPTETTVWSTLQCLQSTSEAITIGKPIANTQCYVLDANLRPVPQGVCGELYIAGDGVTLGYMNRPDLTGERFVDNPFSCGTNDKMYKTGDLCRLNEEGNLEYLGRNDFQVKIRGFRIELGEIEEKINAQEGIQEAVVVARDDSSGEKALLAFVVMRSGASLSPAELRSALSADLPQFMLPNTFVALSSMPLTPNGKVDRKALLDNRDTGEDLGLRLAALIAPATPTERQLRDQWVNLLALPDAVAISCDDDFFDVGGTSVSIIRMASFIAREFGIRITVNELFQHRTISSLATFIGSKQVRSLPSSVVAFNENSESGIFCVPGVHGHSLSFKALAQSLPEYRLYCFEPIDIHGEKLVDFSSVESLCAEYLKTLKALQPTGPYRLIGHSHGGLVALHMAAQLRERGEVVEAVGLIDTIAELCGSAADELTVHRRSTHLDADYIHFIFSQFEKFLQRDLDIEPEILRVMSEQERLTHVAKSLAAHQIVDRETPEFVQQYLFHRKSHEDVLTDYFMARELPNYAGDVCLFKAQDIAESLQNALASDYGWSERLSGEFTTVTVPGDHESIMGQPHVSSLADALRDFIIRSKTTEGTCC